MFLKMKVLTFFILPVLTSAQSGHRQDRVYLHVNRQVPYGVQPSPDNIESDSLITHGPAADRADGTQLDTYPVHRRNSFNNQRVIDSNPGGIPSRTNERSRPVDRSDPSERSANDDGEDRTDEDISLEEGRGTIGTHGRTNHGNDRVDSTGTKSWFVPNTGTNRESSNTRTNQRSSSTGINQESAYSRTNEDNGREQPSRRRIDASPDRHNIVFIDTALEPYTNKPNTNTKTTEDNEISEEEISRKTTTVIPSVDDRAAFAGDKCPEGRVRFNGICVETDGDR